MLTADVLIINNKGEINTDMKKTLQICTRGFDVVNPGGQTPKILVCYG